MKDWMRWILFFPAAIGSYCGIRVVLALLNLGAASVDDIHWSKPVLELVQSMVAPYYYVWCGSKVAPSHKFIVALSLSAFHLVFYAIAFTLIFSAGIWQNTGIIFQSFCSLVAVASTIAGCYCVRKKEVKEIDFLNHLAKEEARHMANKIKVNKSNPENN